MISSIRQNGPIIALDFFTIILLSRCRSSHISGHVVDYICICGFVSRFLAIILFMVSRLHGALSRLHGVLSRLHGALSRLHGALSRLHGALSCLHGALSRLHGALSRLHGALSRLHGALSRLHGALSRLHGALSRLHGALSRLHGALSRLHGALSCLHSALSRLHGTLSRLHGALSRLHGALSRLHGALFRDFRKLRAINNMSWDVIHQELYLSLSLRAGRPIAFQPKFAESQRRQPFRNGLCFAFGATGNCKKNGCQYKHACPTCGGNHPKFLCAVTKNLGVNLPTPVLIDRLHSLLIMTLYHSVFN